MGKQSTFVAVFNGNCTQYNNTRKLNFEEEKRKKIKMPFFNPDKLKLERRCKINTHRCCFQNQFKRIMEERQKSMNPKSFFKDENDNRAIKQRTKL